MKSLSMIVLTVALILVVTADSSKADFTGHMTIDSVQANPGEHFGVKVMLVDNDMAFSTVFVPVRYDNPYLTFDSVSFAGSVKPEDFTGFDYNFSDLGLVQISYVPPITTHVPAIHSTGGILAEMFFTLSGDAPAGFIPIDSVNIDSVFYFDGSETHLWIRGSMSDSTGTVSHYPDFTPGGITVGSPTDVGNDDLALPAEFALSQNYPNPFNPSTVIGYALPAAGHVKLEVFNILGQEVTTLVDQHMPAGHHEVEFDASGNPSGIYFYRISSEGLSDTKKMVLVK